MNPKLISYIILIFFFTSVSHPQDKITLNHADSLIGKVVNGEQLREAIGNVSLKHNNVQIWCNKVIQFIEQDKAELYGNVKVVKDTLDITAPSGIYYGQEKKVICPSGAILNDSKVTLKANYGVYYFEQDLASFRGNVQIYDSGTYKIFSDRLLYYRSVSKSFANGDVKIELENMTIYSDSLVYEKLIGVSNAIGNVKLTSDSTVITSDNATYYEFDKKSVASKHVVINFIYQKATISGDYGENYEKTNYSFVKGEAILVKIDSSVQRIDTLFVYSNKMEAFRNNYPEKYIATDSVKTIRNEFSSVSDKGYYFKHQNNKSVIALGGNPVVWKDDLQVSGDSIYSFHSEQVEEIYVKGSSFALKPIENQPGFFNQMSGLYMYLKFRNENLDFIRVDTNASCIYFVIENEKLSGVNESYGDRIILYINDELVEKVKIFGLPNGLFTPYKMISSENFKLPGFNLRTNKPQRK
jgi:lipopolysaccharide export system protein LptA